MPTEDAASVPSPRAPPERLRLALVAIALVALAFFGHLAFTAHFFDRWDEIEYIEGAKRIAAGGMVASDKRLPLFPILIAGAHLFVADWGVAARVAVRVAGVALLFAIGGLTAEVFGLTAAWMAALLLACAPLALVSASVVHPITTLALFTTLAVWSLVRHRSTRSIAALALAGLCIALAGFTRPEGFALAPLAAWFAVRAAVRREVGRAGLFALSGSWIAIALAAAWFAAHFWYGQAVAETVTASGSARHFAWFLSGYLRALPSVLAYPTALLAAAGVVRAIARCRRGALDARERAFCLVAGWLFAADLVGLSSYLAFSTIYLYTFVPLVAAVAAYGLDGLARLRIAGAARPRRTVIASALAVAVAVNLALALYGVAQFEKLIADYRSACLWLRDHRTNDARGRPETVVAMSPAHLSWWTGIPSLPYDHALFAAGRYVVLSDLFAQNLGLDYDGELRFLVDVLGGKIVCSAERDVRPILGVAFCQPFADVMTPRSLDQRWKNHRFRSAVVELPPKLRRSTRPR